MVSAAEPEPMSSRPKVEFRRASGMYTGCKHYTRKCLLRASCCGEVFACRFCHDEAKCEEVPEPSQRHRIDRHSVSSVICGGGGHEQKPSQDCERCGERLGAYFCAVCNLYDDDLSKRQFHCDKCGICRVGGRENYFHCDTCGACYSNELRDNHVCLPNAMKRNCPICCEFLFDSLEAPQVLRCGHALHRSCLEKYVSHGGYTCPLCCVSICDMQPVWDQWSDEIATTPMPPELSGTTIRLFCNDCNEYSTAPYHFLGLKCGGCGSFNTRRS